MTGGRVKTLKAFLFYCTCALVFTVAAFISCALRTKYHSLPELKAGSAYAYAGNIQDYAFLQYIQAGPDQGRQALLEYLGVFERVRNERIRIPENIIHSKCGLAYLRLYRIESSVGNAALADSYLKSAQQEWSAMNSKNEDLSAEALKKLIATRESNDRKLYDRGEITQPAAPTAPVSARKRIEKPE
jgi:hypothetical protein